MSRRRPRFESLESRELLAAAAVDAWVTPVVFSDAFFYAAADSEHGTELWKSDGTEQGTALLKDLRAGAGGSEISQLTPCGSTLFFTANDGSKGVELWKTNGTASGTVLVKDICSGPDKLTAVGSTLFFIADDGVNGTELWKSDGTASGTVMVKDIWNGVNSGCGWSSELCAVGNTLFFSAQTAEGNYELWKSDGTANGTVLVKEIRSGVVGSYPAQMIAVGNTLFFTADDGGTGTELWKSDGTASGTVLVKDIRPGSSGSTPTNVVVSGSTIYFSANDGTHGFELWKSDGTASATVLVKDIYSGSTGSSPTELTVMGNAVFFAANNGTNGTELWKTDGTSGGTVLVADIRNGVNGSNPGRFAVVGNTLYFTASDGASGIELWKSNGTTGGTTLVKDIRPGSVGSNPIHLTPYKEQLLFAASDEYDANQLFKSNGTESGTSRVTPYKIRPTAKIANAAGLSVREGCSLQLSATGSVDPAGEGLVYLWDFLNTGKYTEYQNDTVWFDAGKLNGKPGRSQAIRLKVRDAEGTESEVVTANVSIFDVMPTYQVNQPSELVAGRFAQWEFAANDTISDPIIKWAINWGDGSETVVNGGPLSRIFDTHFYRESKSYTITIKTTDIDGVESSAKLGIYVTPQPTVQQAASHEIPAAELYTHNADYGSKPWEDTTIVKTNADDTMRLRQMLDLDQSRESKAATSVADFIWADDGSLFADWIDFANEWDSYERTNVFEEELLKDLVLIE